MNAITEFDTWRFFWRQHFWSQSWTIMVHVTCTYSHLNGMIQLFLVILIYLLVCLSYLHILICILGNSKKHSKCKRNFKDIFNRTNYTCIFKSPRWVIGLSRWFIILILWLYCICYDRMTFLENWIIIFTGNFLGDKM